MDRLYETAGTATRRYLYDGANVIAEYDTSGAIVNRYVQGPGADEQLVWWAGSAMADRRFEVNDERNSVIIVTDGTGANLGVNSYDDYGQPEAGNVGLFQYTGQMWLGAAGLYHYKARAYHPTLGRFLQPDPIGYGDGLNLYAYVGNDPINFVDPSGLDVSTVVDELTVQAARRTLLEIQFYAPYWDMLFGFVGAGVQLPGEGGAGDGGGGGEEGELTTCPVPGRNALNQRNQDTGQGGGWFGAPRGRSPLGHAGIDINAPEGSRVVATGGGVVVNIQPNPSGTFGNQVVINHGGGVYTQSAHLGTVNVIPNTTVIAGQTIGTVGRTGNVPSRADSHLHFEVRIGKPDPRLAGGKVDDPYNHLPQKCKAE